MRQKHNPSRWHERIWKYNPIDYSPEQYYTSNKILIDTIIKLGDKILEIGCGTALTSIYLKLMYPFKDIDVGDINDRVVHMARTRIFYFKLPIGIAKMDTFNLSYADNTLDVIFSEGLYEHYDEEDNHKMLKEHLRVAKHVVIQVPLKESLVPGTGYGDEIPRSEKEFIDIFSKVGKIVERSVIKDQLLVVIKEK